MVTDKGVSRIIESPLSAEELTLMSHSADVLRKAINSL
jgi:malate/lactate dehydrogenase